jgi:hypothetical protein
MIVACLDSMIVLYASLKSFSMVVENDSDSLPSQVKAVVELWS